MLPALLYEDNLTIIFHNNYSELQIHHKGGFYLFIVLIITYFSRLYDCTDLHQKLENSLLTWYFLKITYLHKYDSKSSSTFLLVGIDGKEITIILISNHHQIYVFLKPNRRITHVYSFSSRSSCICEMVVYSINQTKNKEAQESQKSPYDTRWKHIAKMAEQTYQLTRGKTSTLSIGHSCCPQNRIVSYIDEPLNKLDLFWIIADGLSRLYDVQQREWTSRSKKQQSKS